MVGKQEFKVLLRNQAWLDGMKKPLRGRFCEQLDELLLKSMRDEIINPFASIEPLAFRKFINARGYDQFDKLTDNLWV